MRIALVVNPQAGTGAANATPSLLRGFGAEVLPVSAARLGDVRRAAVDRIVVAGGDGSIAPAAEAAARARVPLAVVPAGTANDFARAFEIPLDEAAACELAARGDRRRRLDLGRFDGLPFVNAASAGLSPHAARRARGLKASLGRLAYVVGAMRAGLLSDPIECTVACDGEPVFSGRAWQVTVGLTGAFGAGAEIEADPADAMLDCVVIEARSRLRLVVHAYGLRAGRVEGQRGAIAVRGRELEVRIRDGGFNVDGELVQTSSATFTLEPAAYEVVVP